MKSRKRLNSNGTTRKIIVEKDSGSFTSFTPMEAAEMINELKAQLWSGVPFDNKFYKAR